MRQEPSAKNGPALGGDGVVRMNAALASMTDLPQQLGKARREFESSTPPIGVTRTSSRLPRNMGNGQFHAQIVGHVFARQQRDVPYSGPILFPRQKRRDLG